jgi:hypothetical protein
MRGVLPACLTAKSPDQPSRLNDVQCDPADRLVAPSVALLVRPRFRSQGTVFGQSAATRMVAAGWPQVRIAVSKSREGLSNRAIESGPSMYPNPKFDVQPCAYFSDFAFSGFRTRTPGPPPFSSINSTPANSAYQQRLVME